MSDWISVKERLPENPDVYLGYYRPGFREVLYYNNQKWWSDDMGDVTGKVTHWMPLPEPPEGEHEPSV